MGVKWEQGGGNVTKEKLEQLSGIKREISILQDEVDRASKGDIVTDVVKGSNTEFPYEPRIFKVQGIDTHDYSRKVKKIYKQMGKKIDELIEVRKELESFIESVEDSEIRTILRLNIYIVCHGKDTECFRQKATGTEEKIERFWIAYSFSIPDKTML